MRVDINKIVVKEGRFRKTFSNLEELAASIKEVGLIEPIVITDNFELVAGERRLRACKLLELQTVEVVKKSDLDEWHKKAIELDENIHRSQLTWPEEIEAKRQLHKLYQEKYGVPGRGPGAGGWTLDDTAESIGDAKGTTRMDITLAEAVEADPSLLECATKTGAYKTMLAKKDRDFKRELAEVIAREMQAQGEQPIELVLGDSEEVLKRYDEGSFAFCVTDPTYAIGIDSNEEVTEHYGYQSYTDGEGTMEKNLRIFTALYRVLEDGAHCYVFYAIQKHDETKRMLEQAGFTVSIIPLMWEKDGPANMPRDVHRMFAMKYESIFYCWKGHCRPFTEHERPDNVLHGVPVRQTSGEGKINLSQKPVEVFVSLIANCSLPNERGIDPYTGSGTFLVACKQLGRRGVGVEVSPEQYTDTIKRLSGKEEEECESNPL